MGALSIIWRELLTAARRARTYGSRTGVAAIGTAIVACFVSIFQLDRVPPLQQGPLLFVWLVGLIAFFAVFGGVFLTSDSLASERRDGTLPFLFLTHLRAFDVVAGKAASGFINGTCSLLATVPIMVIPLMLGGVAAKTVILAVVCVFSLLLLGLSSGVLVSSFTDHSRKAAVFGISLLVTLFVGPVAVAAWATWTVGLNSSTSLLFVTSLSPAAALIHLLGGLPLPRTLPFSPFALSIGTSLAMSLIMFLESAFILARTWRDSERVRRPKKEFNETQAPVPTESLSKWRTRMLDLNPFCWLALRSPVRQHQAWIVVGVLGFLLLVARFQDWWKFGSTALASTGAGITFFLVVLWASTEAGSRLAESRRTQSLELLLTTGFTPREIIKGQWLALAHQFALPLSVLLLLGFLLRYVAVDPPSLTTWVQGTALFGFDLMAASWIAMWNGLKTGKEGRGGAAIVLWLFVLPAIITPILYWFRLFLAFKTNIEIFVPASPVRGLNPPMQWYLVVAFTIGTIALWISRTRLYREFRRLAAQPATKQKG